MTYYWLPSKTSISQARLIALIRIIGKYYQNQIFQKNLLEIKSDEKRHEKIGLEIIFNKLSIKGKSRKNRTINQGKNCKISKTQIKTFLYPSKYFNHIKVPYNSFLIFECTLDIILENPKLIKICKTQLSLNAKNADCLCRNNLILDYYNLLNVSRKRIINRKQILLLNDFRKIGSKTCNAKLNDYENK